MDNSHERVLCFPRSLFDKLGSFQGFRRNDGGMLDTILRSGEARFLERTRAEDDARWKQLIPYVIMTHKDKVLSYTRGRQTGEARLKELESVGVGGHISVTDRDLFRADPGEVFRAGLQREVTEEVYVQSPYEESLSGFINDDSNPVGRVHLGVVFIWKLARPAVKKKERSLNLLEFRAIEELLARRARLETWSQIVVDNWSQISG